MAMHVACSESHSCFIFAGALSQKVAASSFFTFSFRSFIFASQHDFFSALVVLAMHLACSESHICFIFVGALSQKFAFSVSSFIFVSQHDFFSASVPMAMHVACSESHSCFIFTGALSQKVAASSFFPFSLRSFIFASQHDFFSAL